MYACVCIHTHTHTHRDTRNIENMEFRSDLQELILGATKMTPELRAIVALTEDMDSVPSTNIVAQNHP